MDWAAVVLTRAPQHVHLLSTGVKASWELEVRPDALSYYVHQNPNPEAANLQEDHAVRVRQMNNIMTKFLWDFGRTVL
ncbi:hypothetical protein HPB47_007775 [Ixodes persulcatus]|uniref:Uncharacterized protein n=1 Tax=Ixodes persulcatus TaxID=34615 RepID=A0AC60P6P8_IXOPE|nr:hypothetical protein HPB47_007775 [Ixodes persulcatus]